MPRVWACCCHALRGASMALSAAFFRLAANASSNSRTPIRVRAGARAARARPPVGGACHVGARPRALTWGRAARRRRSGRTWRRSCTARQQPGGRCAYRAALAEAVYSQTDEGTGGWSRYGWSRRASRTLCILCRSARSRPRPRHRSACSRRGGADKGGLVLFAAFMGTKKTMDIPRTRTRVPWRSPWRAPASRC